MGNCLFKSGSIGVSFLKNLIFEDRIPLIGSYLCGVESAFILQLFECSASVSLLFEEFLRLLDDLFDNGLLDFP